MAKRRTRRGINPNDLSLAQAEAEEKFGPEVSTVRGLIDQAKAQYKGDINAARGNAQAVRSYARQAIPEVKQIYTGASGAADAAAADVTRAFGGLGAAADVFRAATTREQGGQRGRIAEAQARATQELVDRGSEAKAGEALAINEARRGYRTNLGTLSDRLSDIAGQQGASIVARLGTLRNERAARKVQYAGQRSSAAQREADRAARATEGAAERASREQQTADRIAAQRERDRERGGGGGGVKRATAPRVEAISSEFARARRIAQGLKATDSRPAAAEKLVQGTVIPPGGLDAQGRPVRAIPAFRELVASVALDMAYDGHVSRANAAKLHKLGYKVTDLPGAIDYAAYKKRVESQTLDRSSRGG